MEAVWEKLQEGHQIVGSLEDPEPILLWIVRRDQIEELINENRPFDLDALGEEIEDLLGELHVDRRLR